MSRFVQSKTWVQRASVPTRIVAVVVTVALVALVVWLVAPTDAGAATAVPAAASGPKSCPPGSDQGVTKDKVTLAVTIINISGGALTNETVGVAPAAQQKKQWQLMADNINKNGGVACRKLALDFFDVNPIDPAQAQQACLDIAASKPFAAMDTGSLTAVGAADCIPAQKIPLFTNGLKLAQYKKYFPYYLGPVQAQGFAIGMQAFKDKGYFSKAKGFKKLGVLIESCTSPDEQRAALRKVVPDNQVTTIDLGCNPSPPASVYEQAVLNFKQDGVSHVTEINAGGETAAFSKVAAQQGFKPQYVLADGSFGPKTSGQASPDAQNFDGAINVTEAAYGEENTPGFTPTGGTAKCNKIWAAAGLPPVYKQPAAYGGVVCGFEWLAQAVLNNVPKLQRSAVIKGYPKITALDVSYPNGPVTYPSAPGDVATNGRLSWRTQKFVASCQCWQVDDPTWHPSSAG
jgi:ABC-type branched-subunit amino acid transport system substrate-binding protein